MAHTFDLDTDRGKVRLLLADTRQETAIFTDAQIDTAITEGGSVDGALAYLIRVLIMGHAAKGDVARVTALTALLATLGGTMPTVLVGEGNSLPTDDAYVWP